MFSSVTYDRLSKPALSIVTCLIAVRCGKVGYTNRVANMSDNAGADSLPENRRELVQDSHLDESEIDNEDDDDNGGAPLTPKSNQHTVPSKDSKKHSAPPSPNQRFRASVGQLTKRISNINLNPTRLFTSSQPEPTPQKMPPKVPRPGPARLKRNAGLDEWLEAAKNCKYLSEPHMKELCERVKELLMEGKGSF